jgi:hypothetical protein
VIPAVGQPDVAVAFLIADADGDYQASVGAGDSHRCVIVKPGRTRRAQGVAGGRSDIAFVSPQSGKVYASWQECARSSSRRAAVRATSRRAGTIAVYRPHRPRAEVRRTTARTDSVRRGIRRPDVKY